MTISTALAIALAEALAIALLASRPAGARAALVLAVVLLPYPAFVEGPAMARALFAVGAFWAVVRSADFALEPAPPSPLQRFLHLFAIVDTRLVVRETRAIPHQHVLVLAVSIVVTLAAFGAIVAADAMEGASRWLVRGFAGIVLLVAAFEVLTRGYAIGAAALGFRAPAISDVPHRSRSIAEFWSSRWNLVVGRILKQRVFVPLAHRGASFAVWTTFAVSAAFHAYVIGVALGARPALAAGAFFLLQPPLLAAERALRVRRWPRAAAHVWTIGLLAALSPLFVEPVLRVVDSVR